MSNTVYPAIEGNRQLDADTTSITVAQPCGSVAQTPEPAANIEQTTPTSSSISQCTGTFDPIDAVVQNFLRIGKSDTDAASPDPAPRGDRHIRALAKKRGIRAATLLDNGIQARLENGVDDGFILPYWHLDEHGERVRTEDPPGKQYCRTRLSEEIAGDHKYTQARGTRPHIYTPFGVEDLLGENPFRDLDGVLRLLIQEGEMKALSVVETGFPSVGLGGITSFTDGQGALHPELATTIRVGGVEEVVFIGDTDAAINARFAQAACTMARQIREAGLKCRLRVVTLPFSGHPHCKGVDDWRQHLNDDCEFRQQLMSLIDTSIEVEGSL